ncbi:MAG: hypothetical protein RML75_15150 [Cyanobacteriota bacterium SKYGB_h_bin112]|nr:hypothetical protein [Cyanobacteriota bacterium SKYGB_h_bin112]
MQKIESVDEPRRAAVTGHLIDPPFNPGADFSMRVAIGAAINGE